MGYARLLERAAGLDRRTVLSQPAVGAAEAAQVRGAVMRLARRHGQAGGRRPSVYNSVDPCIEINLLSNS